MDRERFEKLLADHLSGEISASERNELMQFVESNAEARAEMTAYERQEEQLTRYYRLKAERATAIGPEWLAEIEPAPRPVNMWLRVALVAAVLAVGFLTISIHNLYKYNVPTGSAALAKVAQLTGSAFILNGSKVEPLATGTEVRQSQRIKVPRDGYLALALADGNVIEARGGTQFKLEDLPDRQTVVLDGGQVWAHLRNKPLPKKFVVETARVRATATGTVYGVEDGLGGTVVAVAEGSVLVERDGQQFSLAAGQAWNSQTNAPTALAGSALEWSRMPQELATLKPPAEAAPETESLTVQPAADTDTTQSVRAEIDNLLDLLPQRTSIYLDLRDLSGIIGQFNTSTYARLAREAALKKWWGSIRGTEITDSITTQTHLREIMAIARQLNGQCVIAVDSPDFILLADCRSNRDQAQQLLGRALMEICGNNFEAIQRMRDRAMVYDGRMIVSSNAALAREVVAAISAGEKTGFTETNFAKKVRDAVGEKPRLVAAANIAPWIENWMKQDAALARRLDFTGLSGLDNLIISPGFVGHGMNQAARLGFAGERHGVVNWLGEPAPMRGYNFFSADVHLFGSAIIRSPRTMFFDWLQYLIAEKNEVEQAAWREFFEGHAALFDSIGNEIAAGIDNPVLPLPNVKLVMELSNPENFSRELEALINDWIAKQAEGGKLSEIETAEYLGFTIKTLHTDGWYLEPSWAIIDDYIVAGPGVQFVKNSIDVWKAGNSIGRNKKLLRLLPAGAAANVSVLVYQDVAKAIPTLLNTKLAAGMSDEQKAMIPDLGFMEKFSAAGIAYAMAHREAIDFYFSTPGGIDFNLGMAAPLVANWLVPRLSPSERAAAYGEATVALEDLAKAALNFQSKNGRLPASMDELVSGGFIEAAPEDPFAPGKKLNLVTGPTSGSIIIYSVGPDGIDDQGVLVADPTSGKTEGDVAIILPTLDGGAPKVRGAEEPAGAAQ